MDLSDELGIPKMIWNRTKQVNQYLKWWLITPSDINIAASRHYIYQYWFEIVDVHPRTIPEKCTRHNWNHWNHKQSSTQLKDFPPLPCWVRPARLIILRQQPFSLVLLCKVSNLLPANNLLLQAFTVSPKWEMSVKWVHIADNVQRNGRCQTLVRLIGTYFLNGALRKSRVITFACLV